MPIFYGESYGNKEVEGYWCVCCCSPEINSRIVPYKFCKDQNRVATADGKSRKLGRLIDIKLSATEKIQVRRRKRNERKNVIEYQFFMLKGRVCGNNRNKSDYMDFLIFTNIK
jgi:hypothetical protein